MSVGEIRTGENAYPTAPMYFIYRLLLGLGFLILLPRFLLDALRHGKYVAGFRERLGSVAPLQTNGGPVIWVHCVSVGETQAARPLIQGLLQRFPDHAIAVSTITLTGQQLAGDTFKHTAATVFYFPFDWSWSVRRTLKAINPSAVLIMETELWPGFLAECQRRQIPVALVNGRLSEKSFSRYRHIKRFMTRVLSSISLALMQTEADAERLRALGMDISKTFVCGSLKFDAGAIPDTGTTTSELRERFSLTNDNQLILAASTHDPEERMMLEAFKQLRQKHGHAVRLMIAPRHPERFREVAILIEQSGLTSTRRSSPVAGTDGGCDVILLDTIGELQSVYPLASVVFVGGSIANTGGHNILEPAAVGASIVTGPHTFNFELIVETFANADAIVQMPAMTEAEGTNELTRVILELLSNPERRRTLGERARDLVSENLGATARALDLLDPILRNSPAPQPGKEYLSAHGAPSA